MDENKRFETWLSVNRQKVYVDKFDSWEEALAAYEKLRQNFSLYHK